MTTTPDPSRRAWDELIEPDWIADRELRGEDVPHELAPVPVPGEDGQLLARVRLAISDPASVLPKDRGDAERPAETTSNWAARAVLASVVEPLHAERDGLPQDLHARLLALVPYMAHRVPPATTEQLLAQVASDMGHHQRVRVLLVDALSAALAPHGVTREQVESSPMGEAIRGREQVASLRAERHALSRMLRDMARRASEFRHSELMTLRAMADALRYEWDPNVDWVARLFTVMAGVKRIVAERDSARAARDRMFAERTTAARENAAHPVATGHTAVVEDEGCGWWAAICQTGCGHLRSFDFEADAQDAADRHRADSIRPAGPVVPLTGPLAPDTTKEA